jgi:hypothetical protein
MYELQIAICFQQVKLVNRNSYIVNKTRLYGCALISESNTFAFSGCPKLL